MINIRLVEESDLMELKEIKPNLSQEEFLQRLKQQVDLKAYFLVLTFNSKPVSFVYLNLQGKATYPDYPDIVDLNTRLEMRGKGYASLLLYNCETRSRELGYKRIGISVNKELNPKVYSLYEKHGFKHDGKDEYLDGIYEGVEDFVIDMQKDL